MSFAAVSMARADQNLKEPEFKYLFQIGESTRVENRRFFSTDDMDKFEEVIDSNYRIKERAALVNSAVLEFKPLLIDFWRKYFANSEEPYSITVYIEATLSDDIKDPKATMYLRPILIFKGAISKKEIKITGGYRSVEEGMSFLDFGTSLKNRLQARRETERVMAQIVEINKPSQAVVEKSSADRKASTAPVKSNVEVSESHKMASSK